MSLWGKLSHEEGQQLADRLSADRPFVGRTVRVDRGKKHVGKIGRVTWHGLDKFSTAFRYGSPDSASLTEVRGRYGYRIRVQTEQGESFFVPADYVMVSVPMSQ